MKKLLILPFIIFGFTFKASAQTPVTGFGPNPGNLGMFIYEPATTVPNAPLVLVLHGCTQNATGFASESGWNQLADQYGFYVIYAEQRSGNNSSQCFNWFENGDVSRGAGEASSLKLMIDYTKAQYSIDNSKVYVTGFSAGGAMTSAMLAAYPDVFSAGVVMSGLPYKVASGSNEAFMAMFGNINKSPQQLGDLVRDAFPSYGGSYPRLATIHGTSDYTVYFMNQRELMEQWTNVHGADQTPDQEDNMYDNNSLVTRKLYQNQEGNNIVATYSIEGMRHAIAVDPGNGEKQGGQTGTYAKDVNIFSSYLAAVFFGIVNAEEFEAPGNVEALALSSSEIRLTWSDRATTETSYVVKRSLHPDSQFDVVATLNANTTAFHDTALASETRYYYSVIAVNEMNETAVSNTVSAVTFPEGGQGDLVVIDQPNGNGVLSYNNSQHMGQSFVATANGFLESVSFNLVNAISGSELRIYEGNSVNGQPVFEQSGINKEKGWQAIILQNGPGLSSGQQYTAQLTNASIKYSYSNVYPGGNLWYNGISYTVFDAAFKAEIRTPAVDQSDSSNEQLSELHVYPNPAAATIYIWGNYAGIESVEIISAEGRSCITMVEKHNGLLSLDISHLNEGMYLLQMIIDDKPCFRKIMIRK